LYAVHASIVDILKMFIGHAADIDDDSLLVS